MKTKILIGVLFCSLMGCANKVPKSNVTSKSAPAGEAVYFVEDTVVDQSAGLQVIEALSKVYGNEPNVVGGFIGSSRCPSFLEGMFFDGSTLVFQVRGDTAHARRILESAAGSKAFRLEQVTESNYSQQQLISIVDELNQRYDTLTDKKLKSNMSSWGARLRNVEVRFILNTPESRQAFREKLMDSPAIRFEGPEQPIIDERIGITDTLGISLHPEYSAYSTDSSTASFVLLNQGNKNIMCGAHYSITYEDENGIWRALPTNGAAIDIGYMVFPGGHKLFTAHLYPEVHPNKPGRYRFFYEVMLDVNTPLHRDILMMTEFHLTDNKEVVERAIKMNIPKEPEGYGIRYVPVQEEPVEEYNANATLSLANAKVTSNIHWGFLIDENEELTKIYFNKHINQMCHEKNEDISLNGTTISKEKVYVSIGSPNFELTYDEAVFYHEDRQGNLHKVFQDKSVDKESVALVIEKGKNREIKVDFPKNCSIGDYLLKIKVHNEQGERYEIYQWFEAYTSKQVSRRKKPILVGSGYAPVIGDITEDDEDGVFEVVQNMPEFPGGGLPKLMEFIQQNVRYPQLALQSKLEGRVIVQVVIDKDGSVIQPKILRSINPVLSIDNAFCEEALRIVSIMPKWKPGSQHEIPVKVKFTFPVRFTLPTD